MCSLFFNNNVVIFVSWLYLVFFQCLHVQFVNRLVSMNNKWSDPPVVLSHWPALLPFIYMFIYKSTNQHTQAKADRFTRFNGCVRNLWCLLSSQIFHLLWGPLVTSLNPAPNVNNFFSRNFLWKTNNWNQLCYVLNVTARFSSYIHTVNDDHAHDFTPIFVISWKKRTRQLFKLFFKCWWLLFILLYKNLMVQRYRKITANSYPLDVSILSVFPLITPPWTKTWMVAILSLFITIHINSFYYFMPPVIRKEFLISSLSCLYFYIIWVTNVKAYLF